ncbi:hypothetical protein F3628_08660 [Vibrio cholerae]|nr:hypothetical protein [Vibrio cholerae]
MNRDFLLRKLIFHKKDLPPNLRVNAPFDGFVESIDMINLWFLLFWWAISYWMFAWKMHRLS